MIGVGVDFTIQVSVEIKIELEKGLSHQEAISATYKSTGRSIVINGMSVMAGFLPLFFQVSCQSVLRVPDPSGNRILAFVCPFIVIPALCCGSNLHSLRQI
jgi:hypothetical protein